MLKAKLDNQEAKMIVCKFGGSCTANKTALENIKQLKNENLERTVFVFSAIGKENTFDEKLTDLLISLCNEPANSASYNQTKTKIISKLKKLSKDTSVSFDVEKEFSIAEAHYQISKDKNFLISRGEYFTTQIMSQFLNLAFVPAEELVFFKSGIVDKQKTQYALESALNNNRRFATCGFYGKDENDSIQLFSRGGGDFSGALIAKCLNASLYENWTDVNGVYDINPLIAKGNLIKHLSYDQLEIMTSMDAKVIHPDCAKLLSSSNTVLNIRSCFDLSQTGTVVDFKANPKLKFVCFKINCDSAQILIHDKNQTKTITTDKNSFTKNIKTAYQTLISKTKI